MRKLKVAMMGEMPARGYSGGRYHAWIMAEALVHKENQVYVITNNIPEFSKDFENYPYHDKIRVILTSNFYEVDLEEKELDYVICVPGLAQSKSFYMACLDFAIDKMARFSFINFETPNWYHLYAEMGRIETDYHILSAICKYGCLIFSSAVESQKYAMEYYNAYLEHTEYCVWSPPINSLVADEIIEGKEDQIIIFLRIKDKHKGGDDFLQLLGEYLRGMTCICVVGSGEIAQDFLEEVQEKTDKHGIIIKFEKGLSDYRKFQEIKKSKLLLFPSYFEGYGYPPVEALYCGTKCIVYDLPVLREISGNRLNYCEIGNVAMMREKAEELLKGESIKPICVDTAEFSKQAERLQYILENNLNNSKLKYKRNIDNIFKSRIRKWYYSRVKKFIPEIIKYCIDNKTVISEKLIKNEEVWSSVKKQIKGKDIYMWGCGRAYQELYPKYKNKLKIKGVLDRSPDKIGTKDRVTGKMVIQNPDILKEKNKESIIVLISNKENVDTIIEELNYMHVKYYHSICMIELNSLKSKIYKLLSRRKKT